MSKTAYWYCPNCHEEVDSSRVTWQELHDACGHPVEWIEDIAIDRIREICQAEREGRCVVVPCKVGDTVFQIKYDCAKGLRYNPFWNYGCSTDVICAKCETYPCDLHKTVFKVIVEDKEWIWKNADAFGKTVFLTRAAAEAALQKEAQHE